MCSKRVEYTWEKEKLLAMSNLSFPTVFSKKKKNQKNLYYDK